MSELGHVPTFTTPLRSVWNAPLNRHSAPKVGKAAMIGPSGLTPTFRSRNVGVKPPAIFLWWLNFSQRKARLAPDSSVSVEPLVPEGAEGRGCARRRHSPHFRLTLNASDSPMSAFGCNRDHQIQAFRRQNRWPGIPLTTPAVIFAPLTTIG